MEIVLNLGAVGDRKAERMEQCLDPLHGTRDRMQTSDGKAASRERHVERVGGKLSREPGIGELVAPALERRLEPAFRLVDARAGRGSRSSRKPAKRPQELGQLPGLAEIFRLAVFQRDRVFTAGEFGKCRSDDRFDLLHRQKKKGRRLSPPLSVYCP